MSYLINHTPEHRRGLYDVPERPVDYSAEIERINANTDKILNNTAAHKCAPGAAGVSAGERYGT